MRIYQRDDYTAMSRQVANIISAQIIVKPDCVLGLATGSTPIGAYQQLIAWQKKGDLSFDHVHTVNLDEYVGLPTTHDQSYRYFMNDNLFSHVDIDLSRTHVPDGLNPNPSEACAQYNQLIDDLGGVDLQLLGMGHNGHVGFNEPDPAFELGTHVVELADKTREANARFFGDDPKNVPSHAITMGIKNIMHARKIVVAVSGADKADIVYRAFRGPVMPEVPASILQMHPDVTLVGDKAALAKLLAE